MILSLDIFPPVQTDDWIMVILTVTFLLSFLLFASRRSAFFKLTDSVFKFKNPDGKVLIPRTTPVEFVLQVLLACVSMSLLMTCASNGTDMSGRPLLLSLLIDFGCVASVFIVKLVLYQLVNSRLYRNQSTPVKPTRWNGFFVSVFFVAGNVALLLCLLTVFFPIPDIAVLLVSAVMAVLFEIGLAFKIKTALFRNNCTILIFFLYLCALEFGPLVFAAVLYGVI